MCQLALWVVDNGIAPSPNSPRPRGERWIPIRASILAWFFGDKHLAPRHTHEQNTRAAQQLGRCECDVPLGVSSFSISIILSMNRPTITTTGNPAAQPIERIYDENNNLIAEGIHEFIVSILRNPLLFLPSHTYRVEFHEQTIPYPAPSKSRR